MVGGCEGQKLEDVSSNLLEHSSERFTTDMK